MSQTTPTGPRHALSHELSREPEPPTTAIPVAVPAPTPYSVPNEFTDDATQMLPVIPVQRTAPPARIEGPQRPQAGQPPAGIRPATTVPPAPRRRVLPAVLAAVTACLLVAGVAVGVTGATSADLGVELPSMSGTP